MIIAVRCGVINLRTQIQLVEGKYRYARLLYHVHNCIYMDNTCFLLLHFPCLPGGGFSKVKSSKMRFREKIFLSHVVSA